MDGTGPSRTALAVAAYRAAHQSVDSGAIFADPFARAILGADPDAIIARFGAAGPAKKRVRTFMAVRSRFAEDSLARAVARGVRQAVVLGAGLDTLSLRNPHSTQGFRVFEVDHPATQAWKRQRLAQAGLAIPASLAFAPVDFARPGDLASGLAGAGFRPDDPAFFHWLGVVPYLPRAAVTSTLQFISTVPCGEVVFDYAEPIDRYPEARRAHLAELAARVAALGEPWVTFFEPGELAAELRKLGFDEQEDLGLAEIAVRYLGIAAPPTEMGTGPHLMRARLGSRAKPTG